MDWVYVKFQPYRQSAIVNMKHLKLSAKLFIPYKVLDKIGIVAYRLQLSVQAMVHPFFHVSQLKLHIGLVVTPTQLPLLTEKGVLAKKPVAMLDRRIRKKNGLVVTEILIKWKNYFPKDAIWESLPYLQRIYLDFHP